MIIYHFDVTGWVGGFLKHTPRYIFTLTIQLSRRRPSHPPPSPILQCYSVGIVALSKILKLFGLLSVSFSTLIRKAFLRVVILRARSHVLYLIAIFTIVLRTRDSRLAVRYMRFSVCSDWTSILQRKNKQTGRNVTSFYTGRIRESNHLRN